MDYTSLLEFRTALRRFERWSGRQAEAVGLTQAQHQLLLAVKGHSDERGPTIRDVADSLLVRHHSAVELIDRTAALGFIERLRDADDGRVVRLRLTDSGEASLNALTELHLAELRTLAPLLDLLVREAGDEASPQRRSRSRS